eukprot:COSAG05_NODE_3776_length_1842_cov_1689.092369_1_plen_99_part_10
MQANVPSQQRFSMAMRFGQPWGAGRGQSRQVTARCSQHRRPSGGRGARRCDFGASMWTLTALSVATAAASRGQMTLPRVSAFPVAPAPFDLMCDGRPAP